MKNKISVPRMNYIVFELMQIDFDEYMANNGASYKADSIDTVYLGMLPSQIDYRLAARDAILQTYSDVFLTRFDFAPEQCRLSGTFGDDYMYISGTYMDGWTRLKQFQDDIVRKSKKNALSEGSDKNYIYAVNYYDFIFQKFGSINFQTWNINGDSNKNTSLVMYNCDFIIIGELIKSKDNKDALLIQLKNLFGENGLITDGVNLVNNSFASIEHYTTLGNVVESLNLVKDTLGEASQLLNGYLNGIKSIPQSVSSII